MPFYHAQHVVALTETQQAAMADAITTTHSTPFVTPRLSVNVSSEDTSKQISFVRGKRKGVNAMKGNVRHPPSRTHELYCSLIEQFQAAWSRAVPSSNLDQVMIFGNIVAALEAGVMAPPAGGDKAWIAEDRKPTIEQAEAGEEDMIDMLADIKERGLFRTAAT